MKQRPNEPEACGGPEGAKTVASAGKVVATAALTLALVDVDSFEKRRPEVEDTLVRCARQAEDELNRLRLGGRKSTVEDCGKIVGKDPDGRSVTQAMRWGSEKHDLVRACVEKHFTKQIPGSFSLEQRYRYDPVTGRKSLVSEEEASRLLREGRPSELTGTLRPDVVIHNGDPLRPWAVYDFKFPCPEEKPPRWHKYPEGPPHDGSTQGQVYNKAFSAPVARVAPAWGLIKG